MSKYDEFKKYPTQPGWYAIGFDREDLEEQEAIGPDMGDIYYFDGITWADESGNEKESLFDVLLQMPVAMDAADYYVKQN